jgi:hypothetical protein
MWLQYFSKFKIYVFNILELELCLFFNGICQSTITDSREICFRNALIFVFNTILWSRFIIYNLDTSSFGRVAHIFIHSAHDVNAFLLVYFVMSYQFFHFDICSYLTCILPSFSWHVSAFFWYSFCQQCSLFSMIYSTKSIRIGTDNGLINNIMWARK